MLGHDAGARARDKDAADDASRQRRRDLAKADRIDPFRRIGRQQVWRDREKAEHGRGEGKQAEILREGHADHGQELAGNRERHELSIGNAVAQRQQKEHTERQRNLVGPRHDPDQPLVDIEAARDLGNDRVDVIGIRRDDRRSKRQQQHLCR